LTAFFSSAATPPRNAFRIPGSVKTRLILWGLRSMSRRSRLNGCASGHQSPPPLRMLARFALCNSVIYGSNNSRESKSGNTMPLPRRYAERTVAENSAPSMEVLRVSRRSRGVALFLLGPCAAPPLRSIYSHMRTGSCRQTETNPVEPSLWKARIVTSRESVSTTLLGVSRTSQYGIVATHPAPRHRCTRKCLPE
jgi:hypothetical protein